ncbi:MAG: hypothetical protein AAFR79_07555 [Pseudomonadota bacterium]
MKSKGAFKTIDDPSVCSIAPNAADKIYDRLSVGRERQGEIALSMLKKSWARVQRLHLAFFPVGNPFDNITRVEREKQTKRPATVNKVYSFAEVLVAAWHPGLGPAALICFEWHQRPENVLAGKITWADDRPGKSVRIVHHKTGKQVTLALSDDQGALYLEIEEFLERVPRLGLPMVLTPAEPPKPYQKRRANETTARVRKAAGLASDLNVAA